MQERRRYVRLNIPLEITYIHPQEGKVERHTVSKNISPTGLRFTVRGKTETGCLLNLEIKIPTRPAPIPVKARVVWVKKEIGQGEDCYDAGFEFVEISEECKTAFFQYLCNLMYDQLKRID